MRTSMPSLTLWIGAMADPISIQLAEQRLQMDGSRAAIWDRRSAALVSLAIAGVVTEAEKAKICQRILKAIAKEVRPLDAALSRATGDA